MKYERISSFEFEIIENKFTIMKKICISNILVDLDNNIITSEQIQKLIPYLPDTTTD